MDRREFLQLVPAVLLVPSVELEKKPVTACFESETGRLLNLDEIFDGVSFVKYDKEEHKWGDLNDAYIRYADVFVEEKDAFGIQETKYWGKCRIMQLLERYRELYCNGKLVPHCICLRCIIQPQVGCYLKVQTSGFISLPDDLVRGYWEQAMNGK